MRALVWRGESTAVEQVPPPTLSPGQALVRVEYASVCGSDVTITAGKHPRAKPPLILGHEFMGTVAALPSGATGPAVGQRVAVEPLLSCKRCRPCLAGHEHVCRDLRLLGVEADGGFADYVAAPLEKLYPLPDSLPSHEAALIEPLAVAVHAVNQASVAVEDSVAILGAGPIGLLLAQVVRAAGVQHLWLLEKDEARLRLARELGFETVDVAAEEPVGALLARTDGYGSDVTFDAAGVADTARLVVPLAAIRGRIAMVAIHKKPVEVDLQTLTYREQVLIGSRIYARGDFPRAIELAHSLQVQLKPLITHRFTLEDGTRALAAARAGGDCCKVLLRV